MSDDYFDDIARNQARDRLRDESRNDRRMATFRTIWEGMSNEQRHSLSLSLVALDQIQEDVLSVTDGLLCVGNISTDTVGAYERFRILQDEGEPVSDAQRIVARLRRNLYLSPCEMLCAMACWEKGESYLPFPSLHEHPYWPEVDKERMRKIFKAYDDAKGAE